MTPGFKPFTENKYDSQDNPLGTRDVSFVFIGAF